MARLARGQRRWFLGACCLLGIALLVSGLFPPWIIRIDYLANAHCPHGASCPPPTTDARSFWQMVIGDPAVLTSFSWWLGLALSFGPLLLVCLLQLVIAIATLRGHRSRRVAGVSVGVSVVVLALYLLAARFVYCLFSTVCGATGPFASSGFRILAPGFWLLLFGFLIAIVSDLALALERGGARYMGG